MMLFGWLSSDRRLCHETPLRLFIRDLGRQVELTCFVACPPGSLHVPDACPLGGQAHSSGPTSRPLATHSRATPTHSPTRKAWGLVTGAEGNSPQEGSIHLSRGILPLAMEAELGLTHTWGQAIPGRARAGLQGTAVTGRVAVPKFCSGSQPWETPIGACTPAPAQLHMHLSLHPCAYAPALLLLCLHP